MSDDIRAKAEKYVDDCIASMDKRPSSRQRTEAVEDVEKYTRTHQDPEMMGIITRQLIDSHMLVKDLPRRVAHATFALMDSGSPYAYGAGLRTTREVMEYDIEALTLSSTFNALSRAMRRGLVVRTRRPVLWFPTDIAYELYGQLEDRFLLDTKEL